MQAGLAIQGQVLAHQQVQRLVHLGLLLLGGLAGHMGEEAPAPGVVDAGQVELAVLGQHLHGGGDGALALAIVFRVNGEQ